MGCDIHLYREKRVAGKWVSADEWVTTSYGDESYCDVPWEKRFTQRNYNLFSVLADVRTREKPPYQFEARGLPLVMSPEVAKAAESGGDHSYSHLYLHELKELRALLAEAAFPISGLKERAGYEALMASIASGSPDWQLIYPYCQGTSDSTYREFKVDVPADFIVGEPLDEIIASLADIGGDNQRIVFWFDS